MKERSLDELRFEMFAEQLRTTFKVADGPSGEWELELIEATAYVPPEGADPHASDANYERFSLLFSGSREQLLSQRIYKLSHAKLGRFELFLVPVMSMDNEKYYYETIFNRPKPA